MLKGGHTTIWKFDLINKPGSNDFYAKLPMGAAPLTVGFQGDGFKLWAAVDPAYKDQTIDFWFHIAGTGHELGDGFGPGDLMGRVEATGRFGGILIFHVFRRPKGEPK